MRAMTWWDHETQSVWSQPWGRSIAGQLEGTELKLVPASIVPWSTWLSEHPETLVLKVAPGRFGSPGQQFSEDYVIGLTLGDHATAYPFGQVSKDRVVNDRIGTIPVVVLADPVTKPVNVFHRRAGDRELRFMVRDGLLVDTETESTWDSSKGIAVEGQLRGEVLQRVPYITAFDWAWEDFYPHSRFYGTGS